MKALRRRRVAVSLLAAVAIGALALPLLCTPRLRIVYNASDSVPRGWYRISVPDRLNVGDLVLARLPVAISAQAAARGYLPLRTPILKPIGAMSPQGVCERDHWVAIDGHTVARALHVDAAGRRMQTWAQCRRLAAGELFLLGTMHPASFDSRYFGPISASGVIGVAHPLWTWRES